MKILDPGHVYELRHLDSFGKSTTLVFVKREGEKFPGNEGAHEGTMSQEVLRALIHRNYYVNAQQMCVETETVGKLLEAALLLLEMRAARHNGQHIKETSTSSFMSRTVCPTCGHVKCDHVKVGGEP